MEQNNQELSKKERRELKRQRKQEERATRQNKKKVGKILKIIIWVVVVAGVIGGAVWLVANSPSIPEEDILSRNGFHWHTNVEVTILGEKRTIPANLGIGGGIHNSVHTHEPDNFIHLEFSGLVKKDELKLSRFFKVWREKFNSECILEFCNGEEGQVKMFVNGEENTEFENYIMQNDDKIEIKFE